MLINRTTTKYSRHNILGQDLSSGSRGNSDLLGLNTSCTKLYSLSSAQILSDEHRLCDANHWLHRHLVLCIPSQYPEIIVMYIDTTTRRNAYLPLRYSYRIEASLAFAQPSWSYLRIQSITKYFVSIVSECFKIPWMTTRGLTLWKGVSKLDV